MITLLKQLHFLLILVLTIGQIHICQATYVMPDGKRCITCDQLEHDNKFTIVASAISADLDHGDCHDCCELQGCEAHEKPLACTAYSHSNDQSYAEPLQGLCVICAIRSPATNRTVHIESAPCIGPPSEYQSRAPPPFAILSPHAGLDIVNA